LIHGNGLHLIKEQLGTVLKREQWEQLEINHREDWTTDTSRRNGLLYSVRPFGTNSIKEGAM
jgi:hypothetical protein